MWARKAVRDLRAMGLRAVLIVAVIGAGPGTAAGISLALHQVHVTRTSFYSDYALADLDLRLRQAVDPAQLLARARSAGATRMQARLILPAAVRAASGQAAAELVGMSSGAPLDRLAVTAGRGLSESGSGDQAVLAAAFAHRHQIRVGDRLRVRLAGRSITLRVAGLARSPEYLWATANPDYLVPESGSLAVLWLPLTHLQRLAGVGNRANDLAVDLPGGGSGSVAQALAAGLPVAQAIPRQQNYGLRLTNADIHSFSIFAPVMGAVFGIVGVLLIGLSLRRLVAAQRRELGALLALGYRPRMVIATVLLPALALAVLGALLSVLVTIGVGWLVADQYAAAVGFPSVEHPLSAGPVVLAVALAIGATLIGALLPAWRLARLDPTEAMRGESAGAFALPNWLKRASSPGPPAFIYAIRGLLRRPVLTAATVLSIGAAIGLAAALNILVTSTDAAVVGEFSQQRWNYSVDLARPLPSSQAVALARRAGARRVEPIIKGPARLGELGAAGADVQLVGLPSGPPQLLRLQLTSGSPPGVGEIVLSAQTARALGVTVGEPVRLATATATVSVKVGGIARTLASQQAYLPSAEVQSLVGLPGKATSMMLAAPASAAARLGAHPVVARVTSRTATLAAERAMVAELTGLIAVLESISLAVGALFLVSTLALSYLDRRGEFATLQALGYGRRQIATAVVGEAAAQTALASLASIPLGLLIASPLSQRIAQAWFAIGLQSTPSNFLTVIVPAAALALLAAAHATRRALRIDIASAVRARMIG